MKKIALVITFITAVCLSSFAHVNVAKPTASRQVKVAPFCRFTYIDNFGHSVKLHTSTTHATSKSLTFIFDNGETLVINFTIIRAGHFVAASAHSKDPQILFYPSHQGKAIPMVGAVLISGTRPVTGNFSHLASDNDEHITLVSGTFSL
jgi:hypothetical protein